MVDEFEFQLDGEPVEDGFPLPGLKKITNIIVKFSNDSKWLTY